MSTFELPLVSPRNLDEHIAGDLGLVDLYRTMIKPTTPFGEKMIHKWTRQYTADANHLRDTQRLLEGKIPDITHNCAQVNEVRDNISQKLASDDTEGFHAKYNYIEWEPLMFMNRNAQLLQYMSIYSLASPIISLCLPIICLIIPFLVVRLRGAQITMKTYIEILQSILQKHQLGQLFTISSASWEKRSYIFVSVGFYILQVYQNIRMCIRFCNNMNVIHHELFTMQTHIEETVKHMDAFEEATKECPTYIPFIVTMSKQRDRLQKYREKVSQISRETWSLYKAIEIGQIMKNFYALYNDSELKATLEYSFDFCGYLDNLRGIQKGIRAKRLGKCTYSNKKSKFQKAYFPAIADKPVKNSYSTQKNLLITGPNAAGKTTLLKTTLFNVILSQQFGYGCYEKATIPLYHHLHCYLNIPDTSARDSLFQAEARRCKDIIECVNKNGIKERHFCIFDELYSGTNPYEAVSSAVAFLKYLGHYQNVSFMLTTHFIELCERLDRVPAFRNRHMSVMVSGTNFTYTYKLVEGISEIKGAMKVLRDLDYPAEIVERAETILCENLR